MNFDGEAENERDHIAVCDCVSVEDVVLDSDELSVTVGDDV